MFMLFYLKKCIHVFGKNVFCIVLYFERSTLFKVLGISSSIVVLRNRSQLWMKILEISIELEVLMIYDLLNLC